jgi:hypothetical protein
MGYVLREAVIYLLSGIPPLSSYQPSRLSTISDTISEFHQIGFACVAPNHIPGLWKKYAQQQATLGEVREKVLSNTKSVFNEQSGKNMLGISTLLTIPAFRTSS